MRIALIPLVFPPKYTGGGEIWMSGVAKALQYQGHKVSVITAENFDDILSRTANPVIIQDEEWEGIFVRRLFYDRKTTGSPAPWYDVVNPHIEQVVSEFLYQQHPDVVHATCGQHFSASPIQAAKKLKIPTILTLIGFWYICPLTTLLRPDFTLCDGYKNGITCLGCLSPHSRMFEVLNRLPSPLQNLILRFDAVLPLLRKRSRAIEIIHAVNTRNNFLPKILRSIDHILAPSNALRQIFIASGVVKPEKIMYWPYGINVQQARRDTQKTESPKLRFGYTGHLLRQKGVDILIRAFQKLPADASVELKIYGSLDKDITYSNELKGLAKDPRIRFLGQYEHGQIGEILASIDVVVYPSIWMENSPIAIHEALAAHTPVIATNLGGMADLIEHKVNGLLFERGNVEELAQQMAKLINEASLFVTLQSNARPRRTVEAEACDLTVLYRQIINQQPL